MNSHALHVQFKEYFEEYFRIRLVFNNFLDIRQFSASINRLKEHKFSQGRLVDLNLVNVIEFSVILHVLVLLLKAHLAIIIELAGKVHMASRLNF